MQLCITPPPFGRKVAVCDSTLYDDCSLYRLQGPSWTVSKCIVLVILLFSTLPLLANTYTAASCSSSDFNTALSSATDGDTVQGPNGGGSATWANTSNLVNISAGITFNGNGCTITFDRGSNNGVLNITADTTAGFTMTGFTFVNGFVNGGYPISIMESSTSKTWRVYNTSLTDSGSDGTITFIGISGIGSGLFDHNSLSAAGGADEMIHILGGGGGTLDWGENIVPGSSAMDFFENNTFTESGSPCAAEEGYYGSVFAFRYNQLNTCGVDVHGYNGTDYGIRWYEFYDNSFTANGSSDCCAYLRGGSGVFFNNTKSGSSGSNSINVGPLCGSSDDCSGSWPMPSQNGRGINATTYSPQYIWGNSTMSLVNKTTTYIQIGTAPTDATNCSGHPGDVCDAVSTTTQPSSLDICQTTAAVTASCPVGYAYTPYTYPHPLDNCSSSQFGAGASCTSKTPAPPTGLAVTVQ
jgi:hypothetical protein